MTVKKMRVEVFDNTGNRYTISIDGKVTRKNALKIIDIIELLGGLPDNYINEKESKVLSKTNKIMSVIEKYYPFKFFSAKNIKTAYEKEMNEPIFLSVISTYLSRLAEKGYLLKSKKSNRVFFKLIYKDFKNLLNK
jgi:hypothetical protein